MTSQDISKPRIPRVLSYPVSLAASLVLLFAGGVLGYSLVCGLFTSGMKDSMLCAVLGALTFAVLSLYTSVCHPAPLTDLWAGLSKLAELFGAIGKSLLALAFICFLTVCIAFPHGHVPPYDDLPILSPRSHYVLAGGPNGYFEVSHLRYLLAAIGFHLGWHSGFLGLTLLLQRTLYEGFPQKKAEK